VQSHDNPEGIRRALVQQADHPVRWVECVRAMAARGVTLVAECGPGKVLAPLVKRSADGVEGVALLDRDAITQAIATVRGA
jgi:[acyl-carrier-protein] S-malonyltransferase